MAWIPFFYAWGDAPTPPGAIVNLAVGAVTATSVGLTWTPASGATGHRIERRLKVVIVQPAWTPNNLPGIMLWLDAQAEAERRGLATNQTALLELWVDSSTNAANFEQFSINALPLLIHDGTRWVVRFDGVDDRMAGLSTKRGMLRNVGGATMLAAQFTPVGQTGAMFNASTGTGAGARGGIDRNVGGARFVGRRLDADGLQSVSGGSLSTTQPSIIATRTDYQTALAAVYANGVLLASNSAFQTAGLTSDTDSLSLTVGSAGSEVANFLNGDLHGLIVTATALSTADRQAAESWLNTRHSLGLTL